MQLSYSLFKNHITLFDFEEYFNDETFLLNNDCFKETTIVNNSHDFYDNFFEFINNYKEIENEDLKKPIFSQTTKFKKNPTNYKNYKNYKYLKINRESEEIQNPWNFDGPKNENDKLSITIKTYLNKISQDTYKNISIEFIKEIENINNNDLFEILSKEIINKCLFDNKYRLLYINLCSKLWNNKFIHYNLASIIENEKDGKFYWEYENNIYGPFNNNNDAKNDIFNKLNFKKYFINYIQKLYINKDLMLNNLSDEDFFKKKKQVLLLIELITIMYLEKYISFDIINIIIIDLLHLNDNFSKIEEIEFESLYTIMKLIKEHKNSSLNMNNLNEYKFIMNEFINFIKTIIENNSISKRSDFFLRDTIEILSFFCQKNMENMSSYLKNNDVNLCKTKFVENLKSLNISMIENIYKNCEDENIKKYFIEQFIFFMIEQKNNNDALILFLKNMSNSTDIEIIYNKIEEITLNIDDILLDCPYVKERLFFILENINKNNSKRISIIEILNNINNEESDSDSDYEIIMR